MLDEASARGPFVDDTSHDLEDRRADGVFGTDETALRETSADSGAVPHSRFTVVPNSGFTGTERFVLERRLGSGGFGIVYQARDLTKGAIVALKRLQHVTPESLYRFKREFRSLADVSHLNLVQLYELGSKDDDWFFTMELVKGQHFLDHVCGVARPVLRQAVRWPSGADTETAAEDSRPQSVDSLAAGALQTTRASLERLIPAMRQLVRGLDSLHRSGHVHRDVKPSNVLVTSEGRVVVLDFGLVMDLQHDATLQSLQIAGTPLYMSPEQAAGLPLTAASDFYSVGVMLYEALAGTPPFGGTFLQIVSD